MLKPTGLPPVPLLLKKNLIVSENIILAGKVRHFLIRVSKAQFPTCNHHHQLKTWYICEATRFFSTHYPVTHASHGPVTHFNATTSVTPVPRSGLYWAAGALLGCGALWRMHVPPRRRHKETVVIFPGESDAKHSVCWGFCFSHVSLKPLEGRFWESIMAYFLSIDKKLHGNGIFQLSNKCVRTLD